MRCVYLLRAEHRVVTTEWIYCYRCRTPVCFDNERMLSNKDQCYTIKDLNIVDGICLLGELHGRVLDLIPSFTFKINCGRGIVLLEYVLRPLVIDRFGELKVRQVYTFEGSKRLNIKDMQCVF